MQPKAGLNVVQYRHNSTHKMIKTHSWTNGIAWLWKNDHSIMNLRETYSEFFYRTVWTSWTRCVFDVWLIFHQVFFPTHWFFFASYLHAPRIFSVSHTWTHTHFLQDRCVHGVCVSAQRHVNAYRLRVLLELFLRLCRYSLYLYLPICLGENKVVILTYFTEIDL